MRDSVSFWVLDERGEVGLPAHRHRGRRVELGRTTDPGQRRVPGRPRVPAARRRHVLARRGPRRQADGARRGTAGVHLRATVRHWTMTFDGKAVQTSSADLAAGSKDGPLVDLRFQVEATMAVPPWVQGALQADAGIAAEDVHRGRPDGRRPLRAAVPRHGFGAGGGRAEHTFTGSGLRIRRQGVRRLEGFWGHCWQSALFPSGKAFGYIAYPPRPDGQPTVNEGYLFDGDRRPDARPRRRGAVADPAAPGAGRRRLGGAGDRRRAPNASRATPWSRPTTSSAARCRPTRPPRRPTGASRRCNRPGCATPGTASRPIGMLERSNMPEYVEAGRLSLVVMKVDNTVCGSSSGTASNGTFVTLNPDGSPQVSLVWMALQSTPDGDELVSAHLSDTYRKVRNIRRDGRVVVTIVGQRRPQDPVTPYLVVTGTARIGGRRRPRAADRAQRGAGAGEHRELPAAGRPAGIPHPDPDRPRSAASGPGPASAEAPARTCSTAPTRGRASCSPACSRRVGRVDRREEQRLLEHALVWS